MDLVAATDVLETGLFAIKIIALIASARRRRHWPSSRCAQEYPGSSGCANMPERQVNTSAATADATFFDYWNKSRDLAVDPVVAFSDWIRREGIDAMDTTVEVATGMAEGSGLVARRVLHVRTPAENRFTF
jgi:hypothetical protein